MVVTRFPARRPQARLHAPNPARASPTVSPVERTKPNQSANARRSWRNSRLSIPIGTEEMPSTITVKDSRRSTPVAEPDPSSEAMNGAPRKHRR